jgi:hypothetical protein
MKIEEAIAIIREVYPNYNLINVVDYNSYFVFNITPPDHNIETDGEWFGGLVAVDKLFKVTMHFIPLQHNPDEYAKAAKNNITYF